MGEKDEAKGETIMKEYTITRYYLLTMAPNGSAGAEDEIIKNIQMKINVELPEKMTMEEFYRRVEERETVLLDRYARERGLLLKEKQRISEEDFKKLRFVLSKEFSFLQQGRIPTYLSVSIHSKDGSEVNLPVCVGLSETVCDEDLDGIKEQVCIDIRKSLVGNDGASEQYDDMLERICAEWISSAQAYDLAKSIVKYYAF